MSAIISKGYVTKNDKGLFEVYWEEKSTWWNKLFNIKTKFKFFTDKLNKDNYIGEANRYILLTWFDDNGVVVKDWDTCCKINNILTELVYQEKYFNKELP